MFMNSDICMMVFREFISFVFFMLKIRCILRDNFMFNQDI